MLKNVTLSADEELIREARERARSRRTTLNEEFRRWLTFYVGGERAAADYRDLMAQLAHVKAGRTFSRDELNER